MCILLLALKKLSFKSFMGSQAVKDKSAEVINILTLKLDLKLEADHPYDYLVWVLKAAREMELSQKPELAEQLLLERFQVSGKRI